MTSGVYIRTKPVWNKGKKGLQTHSQNWKTIMSQKMKEWRMKNKNTDKVLTRNTKIGLSNSKSLLGKHCSKRTEFKKENTPWNKNKKMSQEFINNCKKNNYPLLGWNKRLEERRNFIMPKRDTYIEVKIQNYLKLLNIEFFTHQYIKEIEHGYQCDILVPSMNLIIECDGDYWHNYPNGKELDHIRTKELLEKGFKVIRLWENEIRYLNLEDFKAKLL
jgi:very-short-patch-repair endonuclease